MLCFSWQSSACHQRSARSFNWTVAGNDIGVVVSSLLQVSKQDLHQQVKSPRSRYRKRRHRALKRYRTVVERNQKSIVEEANEKEVEGARASYAEAVRQTTCESLTETFTRNYPVKEFEDQEENLTVPKPLSIAAVSTPYVPQRIPSQNPMSLSQMSTIDNGEHKDAFRMPFIPAHIGIYRDRRHRVSSLKLSGCRCVKVSL